MFVPQSHGLGLNRSARGGCWLFLAASALVITGCESTGDVSRLAKGQSVVAYQKQPVIGTGTKDVVAIPLGDGEEALLGNVVVGTKATVVDDDSGQEGANRWVIVSLLNTDVRNSDPKLLYEPPAIKFVKVKIRRGNLVLSKSSPTNAKSDVTDKWQPLDYSKYVKDKPAERTNR